MHKRLKHLISNVKTIFSIEFLDRLSKDTGFVKRKSKINAQTFLAFNTFSSHDMCKSLLKREAMRKDITILTTFITKWKEEKSIKSEMIFG